MNSLTPREEKVVSFLRAHVALYGISPNYREISAATGIRSLSNIVYIIDALARHRLLRRSAGRARSIELLQTDDHHTADCKCAGCNSARYQRQLQLVQALQIAPKLADHIKLTGLRVLTHLERLDWRYRDKSRVRRKPLLSAAKATQTTLNQISAGAV